MTPRPYLMIDHYIRYARLVVNLWNTTHTDEQFIPALTLLPGQQTPTANWLRCRIEDATRTRGEGVLDKTSVVFDWAIAPRTTTHRDVHGNLILNDEGAPEQIIQPSWAIADILLQAFIAECPASLPNTIVGVLPNTLDDDGLTYGGITLRFDA